MESVFWQRLLYGSEITQNQAKMPLKSGFSDGLGGANGGVWQSRLEYCFCLIILPMPMMA